MAEVEGHVVVSIKYTDSTLDSDAFDFTPEQAAELDRRFREKNKAQ